MNISDLTQNLEHNPDRFTILDIFQAFRRRMGLFLASTLLVSSLIALFSLQIKPIYTAQASVMIDLKEKNLVDFQAAISGKAPDAGAIDTEVEVIQSRALAEKVVTKLDLTGDPEFNLEIGDESRASGLSAWLSALVPSSSASQVARLTSEDKVFDDVVTQVLESLNVFREGDTYVLNVAFSSFDPQKAALIVNTFSDNYLNEQLETKFESTSRANNWLNERLEELRGEVRSTEEAVEVYRTNSGLLSAKGSSLTEQQISDLNGQLIVQSSAYNEIKARLDSVKSQIARGVPPDSIGEVLTSNIIRDLRRQESEVVSRKAELSSRYGPRHPEVQKIDRENADIQAQIRQEIDRIVANLESEVGIAQQKVSTIEAGLRRLRSELTSNNWSLVKLRELEREADASRTLYENFLERFKQNDDQENITEADARVISRAVIPREPSAPNTMLNLILGCLLGVFTGFGMVILAEILDNGLTTGEDVERETNVNYIASIPELNVGIIGFLKRLFDRGVDPAAYVLEQPLSMFSESFRTLRSSILLSSSAPPKVIAIASALPNEGKTTVVRSIGRMSSMSGSKTIIVDCDLRLRQLSSAFEEIPPLGLIKYLKGNGSLNELIVKDNKSDCDFIINRSDEYSNRDLFGTSRFVEMLEELKNSYDLIILDTAPVLMVSETRAISKLADCVVMVSRWRRTKADAVRRAVMILRKFDANILGLVLTRVNFKKRVKYGAGDYSYYSRQYGDYYAET